MINPAPLVINEVMWDPPQNDVNQYIELRSTAGGNFAVPSGYYLVGVEGHAAFNTGEIHDIFDLSSVGMTTGSNGLLTIFQSSNLYTAPTDVTDPAGNKYQQGPISPSFGNNAAGLPSTVGHSASGMFVELENANSTTLFLIYSATPPQIGQDIDSNDDGLPDGSAFNSWAVVDSVGRGNQLTTTTDYVYGKINFIDPVGTTTAVTGPSSLVATTIETNFSPAWIGRTGDTTGSTATDWFAADLEGDRPDWEVGSLKSSLPGFAGLPLDHINGPNFPGILAKPVADLNDPLDGHDSLASFTYTDPAVNIFSNAAAVTDTDSVNLTQMVITITNVLDGANETLSATTAGTSISASYVGGVLTLSGTDTLANYQQVLRSVKYNNVDATPDLTTRVLTVVANDGVNGSLTSTAQVGIFTKNFSARINEIDVNPPGDDNGYEYIELIGTPGQALTDMYLVALEGNHLFVNPGDPGYNQEGTAHFVQSLSGYSFGSNGLLIIKSSTSGFTPPGATTVVTSTALDGLAGGLHNSSNSFFLINSPSFAPVVDTDYDTNNDGVLELPATAEVVDSIAWLDRNATQDIAYGTNQLTQFNTSPGGVTRFPGNTTQSSAAWYNAALVFNANPALQTVYDATNASTNFPSGGILTPGGPNYPTNSTVVGRHIFYNQSAFDGSNAAIQTTVAGVNNDDEDARDTSKVALLPGAGAATWANITGYDKGINGIMIDLSTGVDHSGLTLANVANNFIFKVGNNNTPANWAVAPAPNALSVIAGGGVIGQRPRGHHLGHRRYHQEVAGSRRAAHRSNRLDGWAVHGRSGRSGRRHGGVGGRRVLLRQRGGRLRHGRLSHGRAHQCHRRNRRSQQPARLRQLCTGRRRVRLQQGSQRQRHRSNHQPQQRHGLRHPVDQDQRRHGRAIRARRRRRRRRHRLRLGQHGQPHGPADELALGHCKSAGRSGSEQRPDRRLLPAPGRSGHAGHSQDLAEDRRGGRRTGPGSRAAGRPCRWLDCDITRPNLKSTN